MPRQLVQPGLAGAVRERRHARDAQPIDAADMDDARRVGDRPALRPAGGGGGFFKERSERLREGEDALEVDGQELSPRGVRVRVEGLAPGGARVVDEDVQAGGLEGGEGGGEAVDRAEEGEVRGEGDGGAERSGGRGGEGVERGAGGGAGGGVTGGNVDFGAGEDEAGGDHEAEAFGAAGDEDDFVLGWEVSRVRGCWGKGGYLDAEEVGNVHFGGGVVGDSKFVVCFFFFLELKRGG